MKKKIGITESEWMVMKVLWDKKSAMASEIVEAITKEKKTSDRTVKTLIRRLIAKSAVSYEVDKQDMRVYHYSATVTKDECVSSKSNEFLNLIFGSNAFDLLTHFTSNSRLSKEEIEELEALLEQKKGEING